MSNIKPVTVLFITFIINMTVFVSSVFLFYYTVHLEHWSKGAWGVVSWTSFITKVVVFVLLVIEYNKSRRRVG